MKSIRSVICFCLFLFVFNQLLFADKTIENDSLYTSEYISRIYMAEPERALSLLDGAESKKTIPLRIIHELRSRVYRNMYMTKLAFLYAKNRILSGGGVRGTKKSLLCCAKQASPATPSWVVSVSPTGIRRGGFAHSRKTASF